MHKKVAVLVAFLFFVTIVIQPTEAAAAKITGASWSTSQATQGDTVTLSITAEGLNGKTIKFTIYEDDPWPFPDDYITEKTSTINNGKASASWTTEWGHEGSLQGDPEYYFKAEAGGYSRDSGQLNIRKKELVCASDEVKVGDRCEKKKEINSITWSKSAVYDGESVDITVKAQGLDGQWIELKIYENEPYDLDYYTGTTLNAQISNGIASTSWKAKWISDGFGEGDPEFVVKVEAGGKTTESGIVKVKLLCQPDQVLINGVCVKQEIKSVSWSVLEAREGDNVDIIVQASGFDGQQVKLELWEKDSLISKVVSDGDDPRGEFSSTISNNEARYTWTAKWEKDEDDNPEYFVKAEVGGKTAYSGNLNVRSFCKSDETRVNNQCVIQEIKSAYWENAPSIIYKGDRLVLVAETSNYPQNTEVSFELYSRESIGHESLFKTLTGKIDSNGVVKIEWVAELSEKKEMNIFFKAVIGDKKTKSGIVKLRQRDPNWNKPIQHPTPDDIDIFFKETAQNLLAKTVVPNKGFYVIVPDHFTEEQKNEIKLALELAYFSQLNGDLKNKLPLLQEVVSACGILDSEIPAKLEEGDYAGFIIAVLGKVTPGMMALPCTTKLLEATTTSNTNLDLLEPTFKKSSDVKHCNPDSQWDTQVILFGNERNNNGIKCYSDYLDKSTSTSIHNSAWYKEVYRSLILYLEDEKEEELVFPVHIDYLAGVGFTVLQPEEEFDLIELAYILFDPRGCKKISADEFSTSDKIGGFGSCVFEIGTTFIPLGKAGKVTKLGKLKKLGPADEILKAAKKGGDDVLGKLVLKGGPKLLDEVGQKALKRQYYIVLKNFLKNNKDDLYSFVTKNRPGYRKMLKVVAESEIKWTDDQLKALSKLSQDESTLKFLDNYKKNSKIIEEFLELAAKDEKIASKISQRIADLPSSVKITDEVVSGLIKLSKTAHQFGFDILYHDVSDKLLPKLGEMFADGTVSQKIEKLIKKYKLEGKIKKIIFKDRIGIGAHFGDAKIYFKGVADIELSVDDFLEYGLLNTKKTLRDGTLVEEMGHAATLFKFQKIALKSGRNVEELWSEKKNIEGVYTTMYEYVVEVFHKGKLGFAEEKAFEEDVILTKLTNLDPNNIKAIQADAQNYIKFVRFEEKTESTLMAIRTAALAHEYKIPNYIEKLKSSIREEYITKRIIEKPALSNDATFIKKINSEADVELKRFDNLVSDLRKFGKEVSDKLLDDNHDKEFLDLVNNYLINRKGLVWGIVLVPVLPVDAFETEDKSIDLSGKESPTPSPLPPIAIACSVDDFSFSWSACVNGWQTGVYTKKTGVSCKGGVPEGARQTCVNTPEQPQPTQTPESSPQPQTPEKLESSKVLEAERLSGGNLLVQLRKMPGKNKEYEFYVSSVFRASIVSYGIEVIDDEEKTFFSRSKSTIESEDYDETFKIEKGKFSVKLTALCGIDIGLSNCDPRIAFGSDMLTFPKGSKNSVTRKYFQNLETQPQLPETPSDNTVPTPQPTETQTPQPTPTPSPTEPIPTPTPKQVQYESKSKIKIYNPYSASYKIKLEIIKDNAIVKTESLEVAKLAAFETDWTSLDSGKYTVNVEWENKETGSKDKASQALILKNGRSRIAIFNIKDVLDQGGAGPTTGSPQQPNNPKLPDLVVEEIKLKKTTVKSGSYLPIQFAVKNIGEAAAKNIKWRLSYPDGSIEKTLTEIQPGGFALVIEFIKVGNLGNHKIEIFVDPENSIAELREDNKESIEVAVV